MKDNNTKTNPVEIKCTACGSTHLYQIKDTSKIFDGGCDLSVYVCLECHHIEFYALESSYCFVEYNKNKEKHAKNAIKANEINALLKKKNELVKQIESLKKKNVELSKKANENTILVAEQKSLLAEIETNAKKIDILEKDIYSLSETIIVKSNGEYC